MVIYLASIVGINKEYYEAAKIDGARKWKQITNITLPLLKPTIITLIIMNIGGIFIQILACFTRFPETQGLCLM